MITRKSGTIASAINHFVQIGIPARGLSERTRQEYGRDLRQMEENLRIRGIIRLADVHGGHLTEFLAVLESHRNSPATRRRKALAIRSFFRFLYQEGILAQNPAERLVVPKAPRREPRYLSEHEYKELLRACSHVPRDAALVELLLQTGMRLSEAARLTLGDLDLPGRPTPDPENVGTVRVVRKGGEEGTIPVNYKACLKLAAWLRVRPSVDHASLWVTKFGRRMSKRAVQYTVSKYLKSVAIDGASTHTLRHTMATHHVAKGTDLRTLQETLGHRSLETTALYVGLAKRAQKRAVQENAL